MNTATISHSKVEVSSYLHKLAPWLICFSVGLIYLYFVRRINTHLFSPTNFNYYTYLLDAFFHGRVNVTPPSNYDLSHFEGKWYLYWGPAPVLLILPFYLLSGLHASDILYTLLAGFANVVLIYLVIKEMKRYFKLPLTLVAEFFLVFSFAFASPNFFLSLSGQIWYSSQIFASTYLFLYYLFFFKYLNTGKSLHLVLTVAFLGLTCLTRSSLIFHGLLLAYLLWEQKASGRKVMLRLLATIGAVAVVFLALFLTYNYLRFHNILEVGQRFQQGTHRYDAVVKHGPMLSFTYLLHNIHYYFLKPVYYLASTHKLKISAEGNSVFMVYPILLLLPVLLFKFRRFDAKQKVFIGITLTAALISTAFLLLYFATGWLQFGNRYFYDAFPLFFLSLVFIVQYIPRWIQLVLLLWGLVINYGGVLTYFRK